MPEFLNTISYITSISELANTDSTAAIISNLVVADSSSFSQGDVVTGDNGASGYILSKDGSTLSIGAITSTQFVTGVLTNNTTPTVTTITSTATIYGPINDTIDDLVSRTSYLYDQIKNGGTLNVETVTVTGTLTSEEIVSNGYVFFRNGYEDIGFMGGDTIGSDFEIGLNGTKPLTLYWVGNPYTFTFSDDGVLSGNSCSFSSATITNLNGVNATFTNLNGLHTGTASLSSATITNVVGTTYKIGSEDLGLNYFLSTGRNLANPGFYSLPGGLIAMWDSGSAVGTGNTTINLPYAFPSTCLSVIPVLNFDSGVGIGAVLIASTSLTASSFLLGHSDSCSFRYIAIGF